MTFSSLELGWPFLVSWNDRPFPYRLFSLTALAVDWVILATFITSTAFFIESRFRNPEGRPQFRLATLLALVVVIAVVLATARLRFPHALTSIVVAVLGFLAILLVILSILSYLLIGRPSAHRRIAASFVFVAIVGIVMAFSTTLQRDFTEIQNWVESHAVDQFHTRIEWSNTREMTRLDRVMLGPMFFALACTIYTAGWSAVRLTRGFLELVHERSPPEDRTEERAS